MGISRLGPRWVSRTTAASLGTRMPLPGGQPPQLARPPYCGLGVGMAAPLLSGFGAGLSPGAGAGFPGLQTI